MLNLCVRPSYVAAVVLAGLVAPGDALAGPRRVLVLPFSGEVSGAADGAGRLTQVVVRAAGLTGDEVIGGQATFEDAATLAGCADRSADCLGRVAAALHADGLVIGTISASADGSQVALEVQIFADGTTQTRTVTLEAGDIDAMVDQLARQAPGLFLGDAPAPQEPPPPPVEPEATPPPAPAAPPRAAPRDDGGFRLGRVGALPWLVLGSGVALAGAGVGFLVLAGNRQDQVDAFDPHTVADFQKLVELEDQGVRYNRIGNGLLIAGGVAAITGAVLVVLEGRAHPGSTSVSVAPVPLPGGLAVSLAVRTW